MWGGAFIIGVFWRDYEFIFFGRWTATLGSGGAGGEISTGLAGAWRSRGGGSFTPGIDCHGPGAWWSQGNFLYDFKAGLQPLVLLEHSPRVLP